MSALLLSQATPAMCSQLLQRAALNHLQGAVLNPLQLLLQDQLQQVTTWQAGCMIHLCTQTYILLLEDGCNPMLLLVLWTAVVHAICYCYCSHGLPAGTGAVEGTTESCPIECLHGECKPISSPGHEGHYICECRSPFMGDSCNVQPSPAQATPLVTPVGKSRNYDNCALSQGCRHLHRRMRYVQSN